MLEASVSRGLPLWWVLGLVTIGPGGALAQVGVIATECMNADGTWDDGRKDATCDPEWSLKQTGVDHAKEQIRKRGEEPGQGIVVAVLDTGYALHRDGQGREHKHPELGDALLDDRGYSFECDSDYDSRKTPSPAPCPQHERGARDRMDTAFLPIGRQPGHGTGTMSVLVSPDGAEVTPSPNANAHVSGVAPGARVVPIRAVQGPVLMEKRAWDIARGIERVLLDDPRHREPRYPPVDVISLSMGRRSPYAPLEKAVLMAERRGVIVVAAAGQFSIDPRGGEVRFPGQYPSVVGVGGTDVDARPWSGPLGSSRGRSLEVSAPAVRVWRAGATGKEWSAAFDIGRGTGTSFSTPQVAGAAALWLQWYGRDALQGRYGREAVSAAFILHLRQDGFRTPAEMVVLAKEKHLSNAAAIERLAAKGWPDDRGRGILAADKLIGRPLDDLPTREDVCRFVYVERGAEALASVCPARDCPDDPAADCARDHVDLEKVLAGALLRPAYHGDPRKSVVAGLTFGAPFGTGEGTGKAYSPAVSLGVLFSRHSFQFPHGLFVQAKGGEHGIGVGIGYAEVQEYGPLRNAEGKYATIPGFGGVYAYSARFAYLYTADTHHLGGELGFSLYRAKVNAGCYYALDARVPKRWRFTLDAGFGF